MQRKDRYKDIQLTQLRSFCLAAVKGNFTTAAKELELSVGTVWEQVRALERKLQATLLRRHGHVVELTPEGRALLELIQPCLGTLDSLERLFASRRADLPQVLTVVSTPHVVSCHLVRPVQQFTAAHPAVRLNLLADPWSEDMIRCLERGEAELAVVAYQRAEPRNPSVAYEDLFDMQLMLLTATDHPLARKRHITAADLVRFPLIRSPKGSYSRDALDRIMLRANLQDQVHAVMENNTADVIRKYVAAGTGIALQYIGGET